MQTWSGVDLFFVLSGFLIGGILIDAKSSDHYFLTFYIRRMFRILPLYIIVCGAFFTLRAALPGVMGHLPPAMPVYVYATFLQNFWLAHHSWYTFLDHSWSLAVEEQFYLTLPAIIWITPRQHLWKVITAITIGCVAVRCICYLCYYPTWGAAAYTLLICRADALLLGVLAALAVRHKRTLVLLSSRPLALHALAAVCFAAVFVMSVHHCGMMSPAMSTVGYTFTALMYVSILLIAITSPGSAWAHLFRTKWLCGLGNIAYCLYLIHPDLLVVVYRLFGYHATRLRHWRDLFPLLTAFSLSVLISAVSWRWFESRMVRISHSF